MQAALWSIKSAILSLTLAMSLNIHAKQIQVKIPSMHCSSCVRSMERAFKSSVKNPNSDISVNLDTKILTLNLEDPLSDREIKNIARKAGYHVDSIRRGL